MDSKSSAAANRLIAKNTIFLYLRMLLIMAVSLFTSRVTLAALGIEDFGIYNVVGGIVVLFTFVNNAMVSSTQRFLNFHLGKEDPQGARNVFSASLGIHAGIALATIVLAETVGMWFLLRYIQYPPERHAAVMMCYQATIFTTAISIVRAPFNAAIVAHERMSFYAYFSVLEAIMIFCVALLISHVGMDRLKFYAWAMTGVTLAVTCGYAAFCRKAFPVCRLVRVRDRALYRDLLGFSGWSLLGGAATLGATQGLGIIINIFCGVAVNAAMGVANQVNTTVYNFVTNFQKAFNPQIVKSYAAGDNGYFKSLIFRTSKLSYLLLFAIVLPLGLCCTEVLDIWLKEVPEHAVQFTLFMLAYSLLEAIQGPLWVSVQATGRIRNYQIIVSALILANLPIAWLVLKAGCPPYMAVAVKVLMDIAIFAFRLAYLKRTIDFPVGEYLGKVLLRLAALSVLSYLCVAFLPMPGNPVCKVLIVTALTLVANAVFGWFICLDSKEKAFVREAFHKIFRR